MLTIDSFAVVQVHELHVGQPLVLDRVTADVIPTMMKEIKRYNAEALARKKDGLFDARCIDLDGEIQHARAMCQVTMAVIGGTIGCRDTCSQLEYTWSSLIQGFAD